MSKGKAEAEVVPSAGGRCKEAEHARGSAGGPAAARRASPPGAGYAYREEPGWLVKFLPY